MYFQILDVELPLKILIPSKTFLWGEYSALVGGAAGVLTTPPYFEFVASESTLSAKVDHTSFFHPDSPAGRFISDLNFKTYEKVFYPQSFYDPHQLQGGFGRSTAEWISAYALKNPSFNNLDHEILSAWQSYQNLFASNALKPSGYDLLAQLKASLWNKHIKSDSSDFANCLHLIAKEHEVPKIFFNAPLRLGLNILIYKTEIKVKTHEHLNTVDLNKLVTLKACSAAISQSYLNENDFEFINLLKEFDIQLEALNFKAKASVLLSKELMSLNSVIYARGCGALGADVLVVFYEGKNTEALKLEIHKRFKLKYIAHVQGID